MTRSSIVVFSALLMACTVGYQRGRGGMGSAPGGLRVGPEGAPVIAIQADATKPIRLVPLSAHDGHRHGACAHPKRTAGDTTLFLYEGRWETEVDGAWFTAPDEPLPREAESAHPNAPRPAN